MDLAECPQERTARMTVLAETQPEMPCRNLFSFVRHRRLAMAGPWFDTPDGNWSPAELEEGLCLFSADTSFQQCQATIHRILASNRLKIDDHEILYELNPNPRRHRAYRDDRSPFKHHPGPDSPILSPFAKHSAEVHEYWSFPTEQDRQQWRLLLEMLRDKQPHQLARLGLPLDRLSNRLGNLIVAGAEDTISCDLTFQPGDRTLHLQVDTEELIPGQYQATVWATHSSDNVLRREISIDKLHTVLKLESDIDHIGFAIYRAADGECIDSYEVYLIKEIQMRSQALGPRLSFSDRSGHTAHEVTLSNPSQVTSISSPGNDDTLDRGIRLQWLDFQSYESSEVSAGRDGNFVRFRPGKFDEAKAHFLKLLERERYADPSLPIYLADPYFMNTNRKIRRFYIDLCASTHGRELRILCAHQLNKLVENCNIWSQLGRLFPPHVTIRSFLRSKLGDNGQPRLSEKGNDFTSQNKLTPGFHDRYLITPEREILISTSINGWNKHGVTFSTFNYKIYKEIYKLETEKLWAYGCGSHEDLIIEEVAK